MAEILSVQLGEETLDRLDKMFRRAFDDALGNHIIPVTEVDANIQSLHPNVLDDLEVTIQRALAVEEGDAAG